MPWYQVIRKSEDKDSIDFVKADSEKEAIIELYLVDPDRVKTTESKKCDFEVSEVKLKKAIRWNAKFW